MSYLTDLGAKTYMLLVILILTLVFVCRPLYFSTGGEPSPAPTATSPGELGDLELLNMSKREYEHWLIDNTNLSTGQIERKLDTFRKYRDYVLMALGYPNQLSAHEDNLRAIGEYVQDNRVTGVAPAAKYCIRLAEWHSQVFGASGFAYEHRRRLVALSDVPGLQYLDRLDEVERLKDVALELLLRLDDIDYRCAVIGASQIPEN